MRGTLENKQLIRKVSTSIRGPSLSPTRDKAVYPTITVDVPETCLRGYGVGSRAHREQLGSAGPRVGPKALGKRLAHGAPMAVPKGRGYDSVIFESSLAWTQAYLAKDCLGPA